MGRFMTRSAKIGRFVRHASEDLDAALIMLRNDLISAQGPFVEPIRDSRKVLVTFVYISPAEPVTVSCELWAREPNRPWWLAHAMTRVRGTDVWYASVEADPTICVPYQFQVTPPSFAFSEAAGSAVMADPRELVALTQGLIESGRADPFNPDHHYPYMALMGGDPTGSLALDKWASVLTLPGAAPFPYLPGGALNGYLHGHVLPGTRFPGEREVTVYLPPGYEPSKVYPVVVLLDGELKLKSGRIDEVLDAAITMGDLPPMIAVFWHNLTVTSRNSEMSCHPELPAALADELLPWVRAKYSATNDPAQTIICGLSLGGLASAWTVLERPDAFGGALIVSPSLWYLAPGTEPTGPEILGGWLTDQYTIRERVPAQFYLAVGSLEISPIPEPRMNGQSMLTVARTFRAALMAKGYHLAGYREEPGGHNEVTDQRIIVPGLAALLGRATG